MLVREKITLREFAEKFLNTFDLTTPREIDITEKNIRVLSRKNGKKSYELITHFIIKPAVSYHYSDGKIKVAKGHTIIENDTEIKVEDNVEFKRIDSPINVVDISVPTTNVYYANERLNHNTSARGGKALDFYKDVAIRLTKAGKIKNKDGLVVGVATKAEIRKNRFGPAYRTAFFEIYYDSGIDDTNSCLDQLKLYKVVATKGAYCLWKEDLNLPGLKLEYKKRKKGEWDKDTGYYPMFQKKDWREWMKNPEFKQKVANKIAEFNVMKYAGFMESEETKIVDDTGDVDDIQKILEDDE